MQHDEWTPDDERRAAQARENAIDYSWSSRYKPMTYPKNLPPIDGRPSDWEIGFDFRIYRDQQNRVILEARSDAMLKHAHIHFSRFIDRINVYGFILNDQMPTRWMRENLASYGLIDEEVYIEAMEYEQLRQAEQHCAEEL